MKKRGCKCCGYLTLTSEMHGICPVCFWQDDPACWNDPDFFGGANGDVSLRSAQRNYREFGACDAGSVDSVRGITAADEKDRGWISYI